MLLVVAEHLEHDGLALDVLDEGPGHLHGDLAGKAGRRSRVGKTPASAGPPWRAEHSRPRWEVPLGQPLPTTRTALLPEILLALPFIRHTRSGHSMGWVACGLCPEQTGLGAQGSAALSEHKAQEGDRGQGGSVDWSGLTGPSPTHHEL